MTLRTEVTGDEALSAIDEGRDAIAVIAYRALPSGEMVHTAEGEPAGVTYYDAGTHRWYAADIEDCRALLVCIADEERDPYSRWRSDTSASGFKTREDATAELA